MKKLSAILSISIIILTLSACGTETGTTAADTGSASVTAASASDAPASNISTSTAEKSTAAKESAATTAADSAAEVKDGWTKLDKTVTVADVDYTVTAVKFSEGTSLFTPEDGNTYLLIDMNVKNNTAEEQPLSSIMMFELEDGAGKTYSISLGGLAELDAEKLEAIDGSVVAKAERRGGAAYEVPKNATGLKLTISDVLGSDSETIKLN